MQSKFNELFDKSFIHGNKVQKVLDIKNIFGKIAIITDKQTFSRLESDYDDFMNEIVIVENVSVKTSFLDKTPKTFTHHAEVIKSNGLSARVTEKLEAIFNELDANPTDETYKKAKSMVDVSNAIVNVNLANYKFLTLK